MATQGFPKPRRSTGSDNSSRSMPLLTLANVFSWTKVVSSATTLKCANSSLDLDVKLDPLVLMLPTRILQSNVVTQWLPTPFEPSCWVPTSLSSFGRMLSIFGYTLTILWPLKINWSPPTASLLARRMASQPCALLAAEFGCAHQVDNLPS